MLCPKCKSEVPENVLRCPGCKVKVRSKCPDCGTLNKVNALRCIKCGKELLRRCPSCGAYNLPSAKLCRKCSASLVKEENVEVLPLNRSENNVQNVSARVNEVVEDISPLKQETLDSEDNIKEKPFSEQVIPEQVEHDEKEQLEVKNLVVNSLINSDKAVCALISGEGYGKSYVLEFIKNDLVNAKINLLSVDATPVTQLSPFGLFQDLFLTSCELPNYFVENQQKESDVVKVLEQSLGLTSDDAYALFEFLYPIKTAYFEEILQNKKRLKELIKKIFINIKSVGEIVLTVDNFDLVDATSFELLCEMYSENIIDENLKIFLTVQNQRNIEGFIQVTQMPEDACDKFYMGRLNDESTASLMKNILNGFEPFSENVKSAIIKASGGSPLYIGQILLLMNESGMFNFDGTNLTALVDEKTFVPPVDVASILAKRLERIKAGVPQLYKALIILSMLGDRFNILMLQAAMELSSEDMETLIQQLVGFTFIKPCAQNWFIFQSSTLWRCLFDYVKQDELYAQCAEQILKAIEKLRLSNSAYKPLFAQNAKDNQKAFQYWSEAVKTSAYLGDVSLYVLAQKQCLKLNEELNLPQKAIIDRNIKFRLGKLLCSTEPDLALDYLGSVLGLIVEAGSEVDFIDVSSYAVVAANNCGNYNAVIELVDNAVKLLQPAEKYKLEIALMKTRKIKTLLYLGNFEQLINTIENDIKPFLEDALSQNYTVYNLPISKIFETWLETNFILADALILQGNNKVYNIIADLDEAISAHGEELVSFQQKLNLTKAFASVMKGEAAEADRIMEVITASATVDPPEMDFACKFNLIQVLSRFMKKDFSNMKTYLFEAVTFANNASDYIGKNLLKSALGKVIENEGDFNKAFEIYNDQITYFAKERVAVGALLTWFLIADLCLKVSDTDKALEVAINALDVAKNPNINSYYFQVMYKRLIAEIYLIKGDFEATKMYLEKSLLLTKKFNLEYLSVQIYDFYAKYHIEMFKTGNDGGSSPLVSAKKLYEKAITLASRLGHLNLVDELKQEYQALLTFAQLKKVVLS